MRKTETVEIGEYKYSIMQLDARTGRVCLLKLQKLMSAGEGDLDKVIERMPEEDFNFICDTLARSTQLLETKVDEETGATKVIGRPLTSCFENHFAGNMYFDMVQWLVFAIGFNFGPFFLSMRLNATNLKTLAMQSVSLAGAIGISGESSQTKD